MTDVLLDPVTVALNCCVEPVTIEVEFGEIETDTGAVTVTVTDEDFVGSATLVAFTM